MALLQLSFLSSMGSDFEPQRPQLRQQQKQNPIMGINTMNAMPDREKAKISDMIKLGRTIIYTSVPR